MTQLEDPKHKPATTEVHVAFKFYVKNNMFAIGFMLTDNSGNPPVLWGLTNCTPEQLKTLPK